MSKWTRANPLMSVPGYGVPPGHYANGYTNGGDRVGFKSGGKATRGHSKERRFPGWTATNPKTGYSVFQRSLDKKLRPLTKKGHKDSGTRHGRKLTPRERWAFVPKGFKKGGWIQDATASIKRRGTKGKCTPITKKGCTGRAKALAKTFKKMGRARKGKS
tara:strand:- start:234 stop:713 length:480 start_codon:yes stop_codon:yes gene_type:complete